MLKTHTVLEVTAHLKSIGVEGVTSSLVQRFKQKHNLSSGYHEYIEPASTLNERVLQYIDMVTNHDGNEFTSKYLGLPGHIWTPCALKLCKAGLIKRIDKRQPAHYMQICSDEAMDKWGANMFEEHRRN